MKSLFTVFLLLIGLGAFAQSASVRVVTNDGTTQATNTITATTLYVSGLISRWQDDSRSKTNAGISALTFNQFVSQEVTDKSEEWKFRGSLEAIKALGLTNNIPPRLVEQWTTLSAAQRTNVVGQLLLIQ